MRTRPLLCLALFATFSGAQEGAKIPMPHPPDLPRVDENACPFEGCQFGRWIALRQVELYDTWRSSRKPLRRIQMGDTATAITGVHVTYKPDQIRIMKPIPGLKLQPGDTMLRYMYCGEGAADIWAKGTWMPCAEIDTTELSGFGCREDCVARVIVNGRKTWWVQIRANHGTVGWAIVTDNFDGTDALAGPHSGSAVDGAYPWNLHCHACFSRGLLAPVAWASFNPL
jgi:hypothetical protein